jgi:hypothetical protein
MLSAAICQIDRSIKIPLIPPKSGTGALGSGELGIQCRLVNWRHTEQKSVLTGLTNNGSVKIYFLSEKSHLSPAAARGTGYFSGIAAK